jgi:hypothetical protein
MSNINWRITDAIDTEANWIADNPILLAGEHAVSLDQLHAGTDQPKYKIGNGSDRWADLDYYPVGGSGSGVQSVVAGTNISVNNADPLNPIVSATTPPTPTLEQVRTAGNTITGTINGAAAILNLNDTVPGVPSFSINTAASNLYIHDSQFFAGDTNQNVGIYANIAAEDLGLYNSSGSLTLNADGTISAGSNKVVSVANGTNPGDAVNKSQLDEVTPILLFLTGSDQTNSTTTLQTITGLTKPLSANSRYSVRFSFRVGCSGTGGVFPSITIPSGATMAVNFYGLTTASTSDANQLLTVSGGVTGVAYCRLVSTACIIDVYGTITTAATAGNIDFSFRSATTGQTSTVFVEGTYGELRKFV